MSEEPSVACILYSIFIIHRLCNVCVDKFLERLIYCYSLHYLNKILGYFPRKTVRNTLAVVYWGQLLVGWVYVGWLRFVHIIYMFHWEKAVLLWFG